MSVPRNNCFMESSVMLEIDMDLRLMAGISRRNCDGAFKRQGAGAGSQRWGMHCGGHYTHPGGPHTSNSRPAPQENAEVFTGEGVLWACWGNGEGSARVGPGLGQQ